MQKRLTPLCAAVLAACLWACGGSGSGEGTPNLQAMQTPAANTPAANSAPAPVAPSSSATAVVIGIRAVANTPVANGPFTPGQPTSTPANDPAPQYAREWFVSTRGSDSADGSKAAPFRTIQHAVNTVDAGDIIHVAAGTYAEAVVIGDAAKAGTPSKKIALQGEGSPKLVPSGAAPLTLSRPHWIIDGFEIDVEGKPEFAVMVSGNTEGSMLVNSDVHGGTHGAGVNVFGGARGFTVENNHIHGFSKGSSADSHGVIVQTTTRNTVVRNNDIHGNSGDSVQCLGSDGYNNNAPADGVVIENNHFYGNRENAIDIKRCNNVEIRNNLLHDFQDTSTANGEILVVHYSAKNVLIENNQLHDGGRGIGIGGNNNGALPSGIVVQKNRIWNIKTAGGTDGVGIRLEGSSGTKVLNNTIQGTQGFALMIGHGTGGATENAVIKNNIIASGQMVKLGTMAKALAMDSNLYQPGGTILSNGATVDFEAWKAEGYDAASTSADAGLTDGMTPGVNAVDRGVDVGLKFCGAKPDLGAVEVGC
jgi:hypothetical protein